jgi:hypothetical protein
MVFSARLSFFRAYFNRLCVRPTERRCALWTGDGRLRTSPYPAGAALPASARCGAVYRRRRSVCPPAFSLHWNNRRAIAGGSRFSCFIRRLWITMDAKQAVRGGATRRVGVLYGLGRGGRRRLRERRVQRAITCRTCLQLFLYLGRDRHYREKDPQIQIPFRTLGVAPTLCGNSSPMRR